MHHFGRSVPPFLLSLIALGWGAPRADADVDGKPLFDFSQIPVSSDWSAVGELEVDPTTAPATTEDLGALGPLGDCLAVRTTGRAGLYTKSRRVPRDWRSYDQLSFWVHRAASEAEKRPTATLEVQLVESDGTTRFWRRVDVNHEGWHRISLPLRWFRWSDGRIPQWDKVDRLGFWFRDRAEILIDTISVTSGGDGLTVYPSSNDLIGIGFPDGAMSAVRVTKNQSVIVMTDVKQLDVDQLAQHLHNVARTISTDLAFLPPSSTPPMLLVFSARAEYEAFVRRFAGQLNGVGSAPQTGTGFTFQGVSSSFWDERFGTLRAVYTHEFVHGYLSRTLRIPTSGEWLHEGLASSYQLRFHPQRDIASIIQRGLKNPRFRDELSALCGGQRVALTRYWQAMTVVEFLRDSVKYRINFPRLLRAIQQARSTNLAPHLAPVFNVDNRTFEEEWIEFCQQRYGMNSE